MKKYFAVLAVMAAVIYGCKHEVETPADPGTGTPADTTGTGSGGNGNNGGNGNGNGGNGNALCFDRDILPIFASNCAKSGCHDVQSQQDGYVFDSYANIVRKGIEPGDADDSEVYEVLVEDDEDDRMPKAPNPRLTNTQIALIKKWIDEGAKNTTNCSTSNCDTVNVTYAQTIKPLIESNCLGCHNSATASGGLNYSTHAGLQAVALNGRLLGAVTHSAGYSPMPKGSAKLSDCKIEQIRKWISAGAPNN